MDLTLILIFTFDNKQDQTCQIQTKIQRIIKIEFITEKPIKKHNIQTFRYFCSQNFLNIY